MTQRVHPTSLAAGVALGLAIAGQNAGGADRAPPEPLRPVAVTLHRFDVAPGQEARYAEWIAFLHANHRAAVETLGREHTYLEAMFRSPDEPRRLYWLTVQGEGAAAVETSEAEIDRRHVEYMNAVLVRGSHRRLVADNVLAPDFAIRAVRREQADEAGREGRYGRR